MVNDESVPNQKSLIAWKEGHSNRSIDEFLQSNPPSKTRRASGGDGWIWVSSSRGDETEESKERKREQSLIEARLTLERVVERMNELDRNDAIPKLKSRTSGPSKKMLKDAAVQQCEERLRELGEESWSCGKWMFFESANYVDLVFSNLARSIIDGPLSKLNKARCYAVKVATADSLRVDKSRPGKESQQLICLYFDNIWNKEHATEVLECVVKQHGQIPNSAKADLYTMIELDSNHPSKIRSTLYRPAEIFTWEVMREWQDNFFSTLKQKKKEREDKESFAAKRESSSVQAEKEGSNADRSSKKQKLGLESRDRVPVAPEEFWPFTTSTESKSVSKEQDHATNSVRKVEANKNVVSAAPINDDDSETESESEIEPVKTSKNTKQATPPPLSESSNSKSDNVKNSEPVTPQKQKGDSSTSSARPSKSPAEPMASLSKIRNSPKSPNEKVKKTPVVILPNTKKRDRFGRNDF